MQHLFSCICILFIGADLVPDNTTNTDEQNAALRTTPVNQPLGGKWGYYYFLLLNDENVRNELRLTPSQLDDLSKMTEDFLARRIKAEPPQNDAKSPENNPSDPRITNRSPTKLLNQLGIQAAAMLTEDQKWRLDQIIFQLRGKSRSFSTRKLPTSSSFPRNNSKK